MKELIKCVGLALLLAAEPAAAETITLSATLSAHAAVPPSKSTGSGAGQFSFDTATKQLRYSVHYTGLSGSVTAADIHGPASDSGTAPIVVHFYVPESPISGTATLTDEQAKALLAGRFYVEVDTDAHQGGEIRGQIHE